MPMFMLSNGPKPTTCYFVIAEDEDEARYKVTESTADYNVKEEDWDVYGTTGEIRNDAADADDSVCTVLL